VARIGSIASYKANPNPPLLLRAAKSSVLRYADSHLPKATPEPERPRLGVADLEVNIGGTLIREFEVRQRVDVLGILHLRGSGSAFPARGRLAQVVGQELVGIILEKLAKKQDFERGPLSALLTEAGGGLEARFLEWAVGPLHQVENGAFAVLGRRQNRLIRIGARLAHCCQDRRCGVGGRHSAYKGKERERE